MTNIDDLLRQAKPLYLRRKRNRRLAAGASAVLACSFAFILTFHAPKKIQSPIYDVYVNEIYQAETGSIIEDFGLPTDEFGLLLV
ncbi:MAG: hypothetical protein IJS26_04210 [Alphaproteobacteria bacterium]|nr:hypothetical protein [Alphaproteobacteria bacterium]